MGDRDEHRLKLLSTLVSVLSLSDRFIIVQQDISVSHSSPNHLKVTVNTMLASPMTLRETVCWAEPFLFRTMTV